MRSVAILLNAGKEGAVLLAQDLVPWFQARGVDVIAERAAAEAIGKPDLARDKADLTKADFALVMGGDGTLLRASHLMAPAGVPMFAVRFGSFGFLADTEPEDAFPALEKVLAGEYHIDERLMLQASVERGGQSLRNIPAALNDVVIAKGPLARMLKLDTHVSGKYISTYAADGLIVATPTGSTAYSLSAGGPLVAPGLGTIIITPICPHTLNARSLLVGSHESVEIALDSGSGDTVMLTIDGQLGIPLEPGDRISVREAAYKTKLITFGTKSFYDKLQTRLRWGDRFDGE